MVQPTKNDKIIDRRATNDPFRGVNLGDTAHDRMSGFKGIVMGRIEYLTGCNQIFILPQSDKENEFKEGHWFDVERVEVDEVGTVEVRYSDPINPPRAVGGGADIPHPKGRT